MKTTWRARTSHQQKHYHHRSQEKSHLIFFREKRAVSYVYLYGCM